MRQSKDNHFIPITSKFSNKGTEVKKDVYYYTNQIVNIIMVGHPLSKKWVLIDTGMPKCGKEIIKVAYKRFGENVKPQAILLTHGHFDHVGNIVHLLNKWRVPVFAHPLEHPYLNGNKAYPSPDWRVDGGLLARMSFLYPHKPINIKDYLSPLPNDHSVPFLPGWQWVHVPGHAPGQVAFFREEDRLLVSADAFITVRQDYLLPVLKQKKEVYGPPRYLTPDWEATQKSVKKIKQLNPLSVIPGHGQAMEGEELEKGLSYLVENFNKVAKPRYGKFLS